VYAKVAIPKSAPEALTYSIPEDLESFAVPGVRVRVPLRKKTVTGVLVEITHSTNLDPNAVRPLTEVLDPEPLLPPHLFFLADFISTYYRCPLGDTLATILPTSLLRSDGEVARLTTAGVGADPAALPSKQGAVLAALQATTRLRVPTLLARAGARGRGPLDALVEARLATVSRRRRDRAPEAEVAAVQLPRKPIEELLELCKRAPRRRQVLEWLAEQGRPALAAEVCAEVGCSPATLRAMDKAGLLLRFYQQAPRRPRWVLQPTTERFTLTDEQRMAVETIENAISGGHYTPILLQGITGSGKTEVYLRCLEKVLAGGGSGLVLVPEIGLTPAAAGAVERRFGSQAAVLHSALSDGERWREWKRIRAGEARVVVGPRSALFAPFENLGLIVVDEEHDAAYKQQEAPRYNARDLALVAARHLEIPVLLCSATPSVEASALVERDLAERLQLTRRVAGGELPSVELVDLRGEPPEPGEQGRTLFSRRWNGASRRSCSCSAGDGRRSTSAATAAIASSVRHARYHWSSTSDRAISAATTAAIASGRLRGVRCAVETSSTRSAPAPKRSPTTSGTFCPRYRRQFSTAIPYAGDPVSRTRWGRSLPAPSRFSSAPRWWQRGTTFQTSP